MQREWRVAIVEDEPIARLGLRRMIEAVPGAALVGEAASGPEAVRLLRETEPDIVFLDVHLPGGDAFDVLARASTGVPPATVLVTAFEEYAVRAFDLGVVDYLLKPFDEPRFLRSWERAVSARMSAAPAGGRAAAPAEPRLLLRKEGRVHAVPLAEVAWIEAADNYVRVHAAAGRFMWRTPLRQVAGRLTASSFVQISRSALVNLSYVEHLLPLDSGEGRLLLKTGAELQVSRRFRAAFQAALRARRRGHGEGEPCAIDRAALRPPFRRRSSEPARHLDPAALAERHAPPARHSHRAPPTSGRWAAR